MSLLEDRSDSDLTDRKCKTVSWLHGCLQYCKADNLCNLQVPFMARGIPTGLSTWCFPEVRCIYSTSPVLQSRGLLESFNQEVCWSCRLPPGTGWPFIPSWGGGYRLMPWVEMGRGIVWLCMVRVEARGREARGPGPARLSEGVRRHLLPITTGAGDTMGAATREPTTLCITGSIGFGQVGH